MKRILKTFEHLGKDSDLILKFTGVSEAMKRMQNENSDYINTKGQFTEIHERDFASTRLMTNGEVKKRRVLYRR